MLELLLIFLPVLVTIQTICVAPLRLITDGTKMFLFPEHWKEKFIAGLPPLFAHKVKEELTNKNGIINYDDLTYGDIFSTIKKNLVLTCVMIKKC